MRAVPSEVEAFCAREHPRLVGALSLYCGDPTVAEELAQETLMKAFRHWPRVSRMAAPGAWVHRVAINLANSHFRRRAAERRAFDRVADATIDRETTADPAEAVTIRAAVQQLPARQRAAVVLRYYADLTAAETGEVLGMSDGAVRQLTFRGMQSLRAALSSAEREEALDGA